VTDQQTSPLAPRLFVPVDIRFLAVFRVYFAAMMLWTLWDDFFAGNRIAELYIEPAFRFSYHGFSWVQPWPGDGMYWHFAGLAICSAFVLVGFLFRISATLLAFGFTYVFLLERAIYLNHFYLMCLLCFILAATPANRAWSIDAFIWPQIKSATVPAWTLWLLRFQIALPYVFGGISKLNSDWLQGQPMQIWLSRSVWQVLFGEIATQHWLALAFSWGGLLFDLSIVPLVLWPRTRWIAFGVAVAFHLMNAFMFNIGIFPWLMIGATTVFLPPDWPARLVRGQGSGVRGQGGDSLPSSPAMSAAIGGGRRWFVYLLLLYAALHLLMPFRFLLYPGNPLWTEEGGMFAWRMMLRDKKTGVNVIVTDRATGQAKPADLPRWLTKLQFDSMGEDPEMMREFAEHLGRRLREAGHDVEVRVITLCSLNGRKPQPLVDAQVDLSRQPRTLRHLRFILPLREPFRRVPWVEEARKE